MWFHCKDVSWGGDCGVGWGGGHVDQISVISLETRAAPREGRSSGGRCGVRKDFSSWSSGGTHAPPPPPSAAPERIGELECYLLKGAAGCEQFGSSTWSL